MPQSSPETYVPRPDAEFSAWGDRFNAYVQAHFAALGLTASDAIALSSAWIRFQIGYRGHVQAKAAAAAAYQSKVEARAAFTALMRPAVRRIQTNPATTDAQRGELGITIPDPERTPAAAPTSRPLVKVDFSKRLRHRIAFVDERTPTRRARPPGVMGAEVWLSLSAPTEAPPTDPAEFTFLSLCTRTPQVAEFSGEDAGKTAHYMLRWLNRRGESGPWSETASATIGA